MTEQRWCEHIVNTNDHWEHAGFYVVTWLFCPICGAKRPELKKTTVERLAFILRNTWKNNDFRESAFEAKAKAAIKFFEELVDEVAKDFNYVNEPKWHAIKEIKERLQS